MAFKAYINALFTDNLQDRKLIQNYLLTLFSKPIAWKSGKQLTIIIFSTKAKLFSLFIAAKEAIIVICLFWNIYL